MTTGVIFPAFTNEYSGSEEKLLSKYNNNFHERLAIASGILDRDLTGFDFTRNNFLNDEERTQYLSYIFSCSLSDLLPVPDNGNLFVSGYSMGIYASLYYCRSVSFDDGLRLVENAWKIISSLTGGAGDFGMGMVIGLDEEDILSIMKGTSDIEICNRNNRHTFILSGRRKAVESVLEAARNEGALKTSLLPVSKPYHSRYLKDCEAPFSKAVKSIRFSDPRYSYISSLDQRTILKGDELMHEVIFNLSKRMNWMETMNRMINLGAEIFLECGAGDGLTRNSRFIDGRFSVYSINKPEEFIKSAG